MTMDGHRISRALEQRPYHHRLHRSLLQFHLLCIAFLVAFHQEVCILFMQTSVPFFLNCLRSDFSYREPARPCLLLQRHGSIRRSTTAKYLFRAIKSSAETAIGTAEALHCIYDRTSLSTLGPTSAWMAWKHYG